MYFFTDVFILLCSQIWLSKIRSTWGPSQYIFWVSSLFFWQSLSVLYGGVLGLSHVLIHPHQQKLHQTPTCDSLHCPHGSTTATIFSKDLPARLVDFLNYQVSILTLMLPNCLFLFFNYLNLKLLKQLLASNGNR